jgi:hypothetical protein
MPRKHPGELHGLRFALLAILMAAPPLAGQPASRANAKAGRNPFQSQSSSSITFGVKDGSETIDIVNTVYEVTGQGVPGRPPQEQLVLRKTTRTKQVVDEIGMEASTTVEAWPLGVDLKRKPLYTVAVPAVDCRTVDSNLLVFDRGLEEVEWWSIHKLGTGEHLFDTYVPLVEFSIARDIQTLRYVGLEVPPDDAADARLKDPHVVGMLTYASPERVMREALLTSDDPKQAQLLRSYADANRTVSLVEREASAAAREPSRILRISISQNYPSPPATVTVTIPIVGDDLDLSHAQMPARLRVAAWKR